MQFNVIRNRVAKLRTLMQEKGMDAFVLLVFERLNSESCHYISGFRGSSAALIIDNTSEMLITDGRYQTQAALQSPFTLTIQANLPLPDLVANIVAKKDYKSVGF